MIRLAYLVCPRNTVLLCGGFSASPPALNCFCSHVKAVHAGTCQHTIDDFQLLQTTAMAALLSVSAVSKRITSVQHRIASCGERMHALHLLLA
jgi:hypothetical protein